MRTDVLNLEFEGQGVRMHVENDEPWFVLSDVCRVLEIGNPSQAATRLDDEEKGIISNDTLGGRQDAIIINESGLYSLILTSHKPAAKRFKKWVTAEVLPTLRRTGIYMMSDRDENLPALADGKMFGMRIAKVLGAIDGGDWFAEIHPASREKHPVLFTSRRALEDIAAHAAASKGAAA